MLGALVSATHLLGLGLALAAIFSRGRGLRRVAAGDPRAVAGVLAADNVWGISALVLVSTGLARLFGGLDKTLDFYLFNRFFWIKMGLFGLILLLELAPMITFVRWRLIRAKGGVPDTRRAALFARFNDVQMALVVLIPFVASSMTRGLWLIG